MNNWKNLVLLSVILFLTTSCVPKLKKPPKLNVEVPEKWTSGETIHAGDISRWWTRFDDPKLDKVIQIVLKENYDLKSALSRLDAAYALAKIAGADVYPSLGASGLASRQKRNFVGFPILGAGDDVLSSTTNLFGVSLDVSWELDLWGRIRAARVAAVADFMASAADVAGFELSLAGQAAKVWYAAIEAQQQMKLAEATVKNYRTTNSQVWQRYKRGLRPSLDVRFSESNVATAEAVLSQRMELLQRVKRQLEVLLGRYPASQIELSEDLPVLNKPVPTGLPSNLVHRRPDLVAAEKLLAASHARLVESRRSLYPRISLTASGGTSSNELNNLLDGDFAVWNLIGNLLQPLFQGGRLKAQVNLNKAREHEALFRYAQSVLSAYAEVENALSAEQFLVNREKALEIATEQAVAARTIAENRYAKGLTGLIEVLEAQRRAFESQSQLLNVKRLRIDNRIDLFLALGGDYAEDSSLKEYSRKEIR